jgi:hypothetical protein
MIVAAIVLIVLAAGCVFGFVFGTRRNRNEAQEPKDMLDHRSSNASNASVGTYGTHPGQASV